MKRSDAERIAKLLDDSSGLEFIAEEVEEFIPAFAGEGWAVRGVTALGDDVILIWDAQAL